MSMSFTYWKGESGMYLGFLNDYPDYWSEGADMDELRSNLLSIAHDVEASLER